MDQINVLKGYGKVDHLEDPNLPPSKLKHNSLLLVSSALLSTILIVGLLIGACIHKSVAHISTKPPSLSSNFTDTLKFVCNVTRYPDSCFTSIVSLNSTSISDPEVILKLSLQISLNELSKLSGSLKNLSATADGGGSLKDCHSQIEEAIGRVNDSMVEMEVGPGEKMLTESRINDIQTWMSSAMTDHESCLDGLEEMGSKSYEEVKNRMRNSMEYVSNSLAIIANIHIILTKLNMPLH